MAELDLSIGGKTYRVACADGEELHLRTAAAALNDEAQTVIASAGQVPETRMLLMAGLMLADKIAAVAEHERLTDERIAEMQKKLDAAGQSETPMAEKPQDADAAPQPDDLFASLRAVADSSQPATSVAAAAEPVDLSRLVALAEDLEALAEELEAGNAA